VKMVIQMGNGTSGGRSSPRQNSAGMSPNLITKKSRSDTGYRQPRPPENMR